MSMAFFENGKQNVYVDQIFMLLARNCSQVLILTIQHKSYNCFLEVDTPNFGCAFEGNQL